MMLQRLESGKWTTFCWSYKYGIIRHTRADLLEWAIHHQARHQKAALQ